MENSAGVSASKVALAFGISCYKASRYMRMTESEIQSLGSIRPRSKRPTPADDYVNIIYKMQRDGFPDDIINHYVIGKGYAGKETALWSHIYNISKNNFPGRAAKQPCHYMELRYPSDVIVIKRGSLLRYILTINPEKRPDGAIKDHLDKIKEKYPLVEWTENLFSEFHIAVMGKNPDAINEFVEKHEGTKIAGLCNGIKKDILAVRNAVSMDISSGFVEGNNNKFKLMKRIQYGRAGLPNLQKKSKLAFAANSPDFSLTDLL